MRKATDQRDAQTISWLWTSLLLFHGGDVTCFDACHVIWCGGHVIWCDVIACVVSCHVMQCDVMWCALQWSRCVFEVVLWQCGDPKNYSVPQSTTPVLHCTTKYYSSTTLYYKVLLCTKVQLQYYSVLQSSIHDWSLTHMNRYTWLMSVAYETSFTMRGVTGVILQLHQILRLPRKMNVMIDPRHIWNVISNARSK